MGLRLFAVMRFHLTRKFDSEQTLLQVLQTYLCSLRGMVSIGGNGIGDLNSNSGRG